MHCDAWMLCVNCAKACSSAAANSRLVHWLSPILILPSSMGVWPWGSEPGIRDLRTVCIKHPGRLTSTSPWTESFSVLASCSVQEVPSWPPFCRWVNWASWMLPKVTQVRRVKLRQPDTRTDSFFLSHEIACFELLANSPKSQQTVIHSRGEWSLCWALKPCGKMC